MMKAELLRQLQAIRDNLCRENARTKVRSVQGDRCPAGYGSGVNAMWEAAEDAVKALADDAQGGPR